MGSVNVLEYAEAIGSAFTVYMTRFAVHHHRATETHSIIIRLKPKVKHTTRPDFYSRIRLKLKPQLHT